METLPETILYRVNAEGMILEQVYHVGEGLLSGELVAVEFTKKLIDNMEDLNPEYSKIVDEHFWDLI